MSTLTTAAPITIGVRLGQLSGDLDIPQNRIATQIGVSEGAVSQWHSGTATPTLRNTVAYAHLIGWRLTATAAGLVVAEGEDLANLAGLRETAGLSPKGLARKLNISLVAVYRTERHAAPTMLLATCQRYLPASGYQVGLTPAQTAVAA